MTSRRRRTMIIVIASLAALTIAVCVGTFLVVRGGWFRDQVRNRVVQEVEKATGGRAEIGALQFDWTRLEVRLAPFTLHGREKPDEPVFLRAAGVQVGFKIISAWKKDADIDWLIVDRPEVHVIAYPDGTSNVPRPGGRLKRASIAEDLLKLAVRHFELRNGALEIRDHRVPFDIRGDDLRAEFGYEATGPLYRGHVSSRQVRVDANQIRPVLFDFDADLAVDKDTLRIQKVSLVKGQSRVEAAGVVRNWEDPRAELTFESRVLIADLADIAGVQVERQGEANVWGKASLAWRGGPQYTVDGRMSAQGLAYQDRRLRAAGIAARGNFHLTPSGISLPNLTASALGGGFEGRAELADHFERLRVEGTARNLSLAELPKVAVGKPRLVWSGNASGQVRIDGRIDRGRPRDFTVQASMDITPLPGATPIHGKVDMIYDQRANSIRLANSTIETAVSRISFSGTLGQVLRVSLQTGNLDDLLPGLALLSPDAPKQLPLALAGGSASANMTVSGALSATTVAGRVTVGRFETVGRTFDSAVADVTLSRGAVTARNLRLTEGAMRVNGGGRIELRDWKAADSSAVSGSFSVRGGDLRAVLGKAGENLAVSGNLSATAQVSGTYGAPLAAIQLSLDHPAAFGEAFDQLHADGVVNNAAVRVNAGELRAGRGEVRFHGSYLRTGTDWTTGSAQFDVEGGGFTLDQFQHVRQFRTGLSGVLRVKASGTARVRKADLDIDSLTGEVNVTDVMRGEARIGNLLATAQTRGNTLAVQVTGSVRKSEFRGTGEWRLEGDYPGSGTLQFTPIEFEALHEVMVLGAAERELPYVGIVEGRASISGPLKKPEMLKAEIVLPRVQVSSNPNRPLRAGARGQDLMLRNTEPVRMVASLDSVDIQSASFAATDTSLDVAGRVTFSAKSPWNVDVRGRMNLAILQLFNADIAARGNAILNANVRGAIADPEVNGRLELRNASLYLAGLPPGVGVDNASGVVVFDRNRGNIENLTAEVGGGRIGFDGFVGFGGGALLYHVHGQAEKVRLRHPDGVSATMNADLNLSGSSESGLVSGTITVTRAALEPGADLGSLLAQTAKPLPAPVEPGEYLRGLNFDIRVESGPTLEVQTSLTRNLGTEAELRVRGNIARPTLTGDISINQGEIQFFGNKYAINRCDLRFINLAKIEPVFDVDLETKARGITVNISFSGTMNKLNVSYRSDPPLQSSDIIALLAVGRDPALAAITNAQARTNLLETGASTLSQAVASPVSNRLQRFFGVSRLKIDPSLTGVDNIPQARLTLEQQVSRDVTLTYITNLQRTQEQLVQLQWDINRKWSAIAVREENGVFGIDIQYRKRFK